MKKFLSAEVIASFTVEGDRGHFWYKAEIGEDYAKQLIGLSKAEEKVAGQLFSNTLVTRLKQNFATELDDLHLVFGKSGTCTAFMLRKILEKLIYLVFAKNSLDNKLDNNGQLIGLEAMVNVAKQEKIAGQFILMPKTGKELLGVKFLGDSAAHNPLTNVAMSTIIPQMPFIITAYEELSLRL